VVLVLLLGPLDLALELVAVPEAESSVDGLELLDRLWAGPEKVVPYPAFGAFQNGRKVKDGDLLDWFGLDEERNKKEII
jgi:hypothetical protein